MGAWLISAVFLATTLAAPAAAPRPAPAAQWNISAFEFYVEGYRPSGITGFILYMSNDAGGPLGSFECTEGNIFASFARPGLDPRADLERQWGYRTAGRRVNWAVGGGEWSRREGWAWVDPGYYRPVDFDTKMAMWNAAKAETRFSIREDDEVLVIDWPKHDATMDQFIEACGWAED